MLLFISLLHTFTKLTHNKPISFIITSLNYFKNIDIKIFFDIINLERWKKNELSFGIP